MSFSRENIQNVVFGGVGVEGTAYVGALAELETQLGSLNQIKRVAGTSSGSIMSMLVALNCTAAQISDYYNTIDFAKIADDKFFAEAYNLLRHLSEYNNTVLRATIGALMVSAIGTTDLTFRDMHTNGYKDLHIVTTQLVKIDGIPSRKYQEYSFDKTPDTQVLSAIMASTAIPFVFPGIPMKEVSSGKWVEHSDGFLHIDGGYVDDLPMEIFDKKKYHASLPAEEKNNLTQRDEIMYNPQTLGFMVYSTREVKDLKTGVKDVERIEPHEYFNLAYAYLYGAIFGPQRHKFIVSHDAERTVLIDGKGQTATNFKITEAEKSELKLAGTEATKDFFKAKLSAANSPKLSSVKTLFSPIPAMSTSDSAAVSKPSLSLLRK